MNGSDFLIADRLTIRCRGDVYYPREDSIAMAEAVEEMAHGRALDLGTGSGIQGIVAAVKGCDVTFADIDDEAIKCAKENAEANGVGGEFVKSDMFSDIKGRFDTIIFNPPYTKSKPLKQMDEKHIVRALYGGKYGRELIEKFISGYKEHLAYGGIALLLESSINGYEGDIMRHNAAVVVNKHYFFEDLVVLLFR